LLDLDTRTAILRLAAEGHGSRKIANTLGISRNVTRKIMESGQKEVPSLFRPTQLDEHAEALRGLFLECQGNRIRVLEELEARYNVNVRYSTLTRYCREAGIGVEIKPPAGRYHFDPGQEMQHDTSPHNVVVGGKRVPLQCASLVMCYSRRRFIQCYHKWNRFHVKVFLTQALRCLGSIPTQCMLDNSTVIMVGGTGTDAYPAPEMAAFSKHFGFKFVAHFVGDANRSARVEGPFNHVEKNFYPGRTFDDLGDLNRQLLAWCEKYNTTFHKSFGGIPNELGVQEALAGKPLPLHIPDPVAVHRRRVTAEGYIQLHTHLYSAPPKWVGKHLEVHESYSEVRVFSGHDLVTTHDRRQIGKRTRNTKSDHLVRRGRHDSQRPPSPEEETLRGQGPVLIALCDALRKDRTRGYRAIRRLHKMWMDYPTDALNTAILRALDFGLLDLSRIEDMVLRDIRGNYFRITTTSEEPPITKDKTDG